MVKNLSDKSKNQLQVKSFEVAIIKNPDSRPFLNVFHASGQNIQQQKLGEIFGIIQIDDTSKNSAYLPNMLTQIIKKEYFKNKNKDCSESFEIALHKINLALTELTQHEIVEWMNGLNVAIGAICGNEIHFTQIGRGRILFLKNKKISIIGDGPDKNADYHPMKTFSSISAGKVENKDKIIFTLAETFDTLEKKDLERHFKTFNSDEFDNLISSTLKNEASNTGIVVANIKNQLNEKSDLIIDSEIKPEIEENLNFFGDAKKKKVPSPNRKETKLKEKTSKEEIKIEKRAIKIEDTDKSPFENEPEIYCKETEEEEAITELENNKISETIKNNSIQLLEKIKVLAKNKFALKNISGKKIVEKTFEIIKKIDKNKIIKIKDQTQALIKKIKIPALKSFEKPDFLKNWKTSLLKNNKTKKTLDTLGVETNFETNEVNSTENTSQNDYLKKTKKLFSNTQNYFQNKISKKILIIILVSIVLIFLSFLVIANKNNKLEPADDSFPLEKKIQTEKIDFSVKNLRTLMDIDKEIKDSTLLKNDLFLLTENQSLIKFSIRNNTKTEILLPKELKNPSYLSSIESLSLVFIVSQDQTYSYSPVTNNFSKNIIAMPESFKSVGIGTYLTYLYLLDQETNQIYRYDRVPGGFGTAKKWLKKPANLENATSFDVSDSIYIAFNNGKIQKYFSNELKKEFNLEENFEPHKIRTKINQNEIFALDRKQGKIVMLFENNNQQVFFEDKKFKNANDFSVDFENKKVFVITKKNQIVEFNYQ